MTAKGQNQTLVLTVCAAIDRTVLYHRYIFTCWEFLMKIHTVKGAAGVNLHVREYGKSTGIPILLIHGWSQSHLCWSKQYQSSLKDEVRMVALDLRGHGMSDAPVELDQYTDGDKWADDIEAVIDELSLDRPILVGWSYGATSFRTMCAEKAKARLLGSILSTPLSSLARL